MYSRAHLLIENEINDVNNNEKDISIIKLSQENVFELIALVNGLPNTIWENGIFQLYLKFSENYNFTPPKVYFQTIPYHPNIDISNGRPSIDFLDDITKWRTDYTIKYILKSIQHLLTYPMLDRSVNMDAVFMLKGNPAHYELLAKQSVIATQKIRKILRETENELINEKEMYLLSSTDTFKFNYLTKIPLFKITKDDSNLIKDQNDFKSEKNSIKNKFLVNISYDEYCNLWKGIATTKSKNNDENIYLKSDVFQKPNIMSQHISISIKELEEQINKQLNEHRNIMYGRFNFENKKNQNEFDSKLNLNLNKQEKSSNLNVLNNNNKIQTGINYNNLNKVSQQENSLSNQLQLSLPNRIEIPIEINTGKNIKTILENEDDLFEKEVDDLLDWTKNI